MRIIPAKGHMKIFLFILFFLLLIGVLLFFQHKKSQPTTTLTPVTVALDWTPNTNHTGLYVALAKGWYKEQGLAVKILPYTTTSSDILVASGKANVGISATEGVLSDAAAGSPVVSIAAILSHNTSGFLTLSDTGIINPKDFDGKIYGGFGSPAESAVVSAIIKKDGGKGNFKNVTLSVDAMQALQTKKIDFVWVFQGWETIAAKRQGLKTTYFPSLKYGIPDYYTPVIITSPKEIKHNPQLVKKFMTATTKGYEYAIAHPKESAQILIDQTPKGTFPDTGLVFASQEFLSKNYADKGSQWGVQKKNFWHAYPQFLLDNDAVLDSNGKVIKKLNLDSLYTNEFLTH